MNKREAIQAMLDGHNVTNTKMEPNCYIYLDSEGVYRDEEDDIIPLQLDYYAYAKDGWCIHTPLKKLVKYYRPDIIKPLNEPPYKSAAVEFYKTKEAFEFFINMTEVLVWEEIEAEE